MAQINNGVLYVEYFEPTGNVGEYTFENGIYNSQNDSTGDGALILSLDYVLFAPVSDINTLMPIPGTVNRYKFTNIIYIDTVRISGTIVFDESGEEIGSPTGGSFCLISKVTPNLKLATPPLDDLYSDLIKGGTVSAMMNDLINILDKVSSSGGSGTGDTNSNPIKTVPVITNGQTSFQLPFTPVNKERCLLLVNGLAYNYGSGHDFTITGDTLSWLNGMVLETSDHVVIR